MLNDPETLHDDELVARAQRDEREAFVALMRRHNRSLYRAVRSVLHDEPLVEDVMQDAWVNAFTNVHSLANPGAFCVWLRQIGVREALHRARRLHLAPFAPISLDALEPASSGADPERAAGLTELQGALERAIDALPDGFREVFMLRTVEGCSVAETATVLGVHEETVKTRHFRARARLQATLASWSEQAATGLYSFHADRCTRLATAVLGRLRRPSPGLAFPDEAGRQSPPPPPSPRPRPSPLPR